MWYLVKEFLLLAIVLHAEATGLLLAQTPCSNADSALPKITVHVYNYAQVSLRQLAEAERETSNVLKAAGLAAEWVTCPVSDQDHGVNPACDRRLLPSELVLNIMPHQNGTGLRYGDTFGYAQLFTSGQIGHYAFLFYDRLHDFARGNLSEGQLLGGVASHEIGHLLLGSTAHTLRGLMSARWDKDDLDQLSWDQLRFNPAQVEQLRAGLKARCTEFRPTTR